MSKSTSLSESLSSISQKDSTASTATTQTAKNYYTNQPTATTDSTTVQPIAVIDTPSYAKNVELKSWNSILFKDISSVKNIEAITKPVFFKTATSENNSLPATHYSTYIKQADYFKKSESFTSTPWFLIAVFMCLLLFAWLQYFFKKHIGKMFIAIFDNNQAQRLFADKNVLIERVFTFLNLIFILTSGLFIFQLIKFYGISVGTLNDLQLFIASSISMLAIFTLRFILNWIVGQLFNWKNEMKEYNYNVFLSYKVLGLVLLPIVICMAYVPEFQKNILIYIAFALIGILYIIRYTRGMYLLGKKGFLLFYLILYFCTIEILPLLLLYRWLFISM
jgi:hypothetical protein